MKLAALLGWGLLAAAIAALVVTNPDPEDYADYATVQASRYLSAEVCQQVPPSLGGLLNGQCADLVETLRPQLSTLVQDQTERLNLGVASLYRTALGIPNMPLLPEYRIETIGILNRFVTYRVSEVR